MKKMKKLLAVLLAAIMVMSVGTSVFADESPTYYITVTDAHEGETYNAYKIFDATYSGNNVAYTISTSNKFYSTISGTDGQSLFTLTASASDSSTYSVTKNSSYSGSDDEFAAAVVTLIKTAIDNSSNTDDPIVATTSATCGAEQTSVTIDLDSYGAGYYYVSTTTGSVVSLDTAKPTASVKDKNTAPTVDKTVSDAAEGEYDSSNTAGIGDTVYFKAVIKNINDASKIVFHDTMSTGLTFGSVTSVKLNDTTALTADTDYKVAKESLSDTCTFEIDFSDYLSGADGLTDSSTLVIYYTATVNEDAVIGGDGNNNTAQVSYGDKSKSETSSTKTYVYDLYIYKYTGTLNSGETALSDAKFQLTNAEGKIAYFAYTSSTNTYILAGWVTSASSVPDNTDAVTYTAVLTSDETNTIYIEGLDADVKYTLTETEAPSGYNLLSSAITLMITDNDSTHEISDITDGADSGAQSIAAKVNEKANTIAVQNNAGSSLPSTGGIGTTIFYIIGAILVLGAAVVLVTRRRVSR